MNEKEILKKIQRIEIFTNRLVNTVFAGEYESVFKGQGITFDEVREYQAGDEIRTIDWNVTALDGTSLYQKIRRRTRTRDDVSRGYECLNQFSVVSPRRRQKSPPRSQHSSLFPPSRTMDKVGLICFTDTVEHFVAPRKGKRHVLRVVRDILHFQPQQPGTNIETALAFVDQVLKPHSVVFLISDFKIYRV